MELERGSEVKSCSSCVWDGKRGSELHVYTPRPDGQIACLEDFEEVGTACPSKLVLYDRLDLI